MNLLDTYKKRGDDLQGLKEELEKMDASTELMKINSDDLEVLAYAPRLTKTPPNGVGFFSFSRRTFSARQRSGDNEIHCFQKAAFDKSLFDEMANGPMFLLQYGPKAMYCSEKTLTTLQQRCGLAGQWLTVPSLERNEAIARALSDASVKMSLILRTTCIAGKKVSKVFAAPSATYSTSKLSHIYEYIKGLMTELPEYGATLKFWENTHRLTTAYVEFPLFGETTSKSFGLPEVIIPGVLIRSSETCNSSFMVTGTLRLQGCKEYILRTDAPGTFAAQHSGTTFDLPKMLEQSRDCMKAAQHLLKQIAMATYDVVSIKTKATAKRTIMSYVREMQLTGMLGKNRSKAIQDALIEHFEKQPEVSAYDIAMQLFRFEEYLEGGSEHVEDRIRKAMSKAIGVRLKTKTVTLEV